MEFSVSTQRDSDNKQPTAKNMARRKKNDTIRSIEGADGSSFSRMDGPHLTVPAPVTKAERLQGFLNQLKQASHATPTERRRTAPVSLAENPAAEEAIAKPAVPAETVPRIDDEALISQQVSDTIARLDVARQEFAHQAGQRRISADELGLNPVSPQPQAVDEPTTKEQLVMSISAAIATVLNEAQVDVDVAQPATMEALEEIRSVTEQAKAAFSVEPAASVEPTASVETPAPTRPDQAVDTPIQHAAHSAHSAHSAQSVMEKLASLPHATRTRSMSAKVAAGQNQQSQQGPAKPDVVIGGPAGPSEAAVEPEISAIQQSVLPAAAPLPTPPKTENPVSETILDGQLANVGAFISADVAAWDVEEFQWPEITDQFLDKGLDAIHRLASYTLDMLGENDNRIAITAAHRSVGSSALSMTLARWAVANDRRVLLVDANLANPNLSQAIGLAPNVSWLNSVRESTEPSEAIIRSQRSGVCVMPVTPMVDRASWPQFMFDQLGAQIDQVRHAFDLVVLDVGPVGQMVSELSQSDRLVDAVMIVDQDLTSEGFQQAKDRLLNFGVKKVVAAQNAAPKF